MSVNAMLRHPLVAVAFALALTGLVGAFLISSHHERAIERERLQQQHVLRSRALATFTTVVHARLAKASLLHAALKRNTPREELVIAKRDHDAAVVEWATNLPATVMAVRQLVTPDTAAAVEELVRTQLQRPFSLVNACLADEYHTKLALQPKPNLNCDTEALLMVAGDCGEAMVRLLSRETGLAASSIAPEEIRRRCDVSKIAII